MGSLRRQPAEERLKFEAADGPEGVAEEDPLQEIGVALGGSPGRRRRRGQRVPERGNAGESWSGFTALTGAGFSAALLSAPGAGVAESALVPASAPTTFRTGASAGYVASVIATLANVPADAWAATLEMFVWDNHGGNLIDPQQARFAWMAGVSFGGSSGAFRVTNIGGNVNSPPYLTAAKL